MHFPQPSSETSRQAPSPSQGGGDYGAIFSQRGRSYDQAMREQPEVRRQEFLQLFRNAQPGSRDVVLDIPSLGGYLSWYVPDLEQVINRDFAPSFQPEVLTVSPYGDWGVNQKVTRVVCLAALHHVEDLQAFLDNLVRQTEPGTLIHLADVGQGSHVGHFLDDFVGARTSTGHQGHYRDWSQVALPPGLKRQDLATLACPWTFADASAAARYTRLLFGMERGEDDELLEGLASMVGLERHGAGAITVAWELTYLDLLRV